MTCQICIIRYFLNILYHKIINSIDYIALKFELRYNNFFNLSER